MSHKIYSQRASIGEVLTPYILGYSQGPSGAKGQAGQPGIKELLDPREPLVPEDQRVPKVSRECVVPRDSLEQHKVYV